MNEQEIRQTIEVLKQLPPEYGGIELTAKCHDCGKTFGLRFGVTDDELVIQGGAIYFTTYGIFCKCDDCHQNNPELRRFVPCQVYSRIVGYMRPLNDWNVGKVVEFNRRKMFKPEFVGKRG